jgi:hypothetical protein
VIPVKPETDLGSSEVSLRLGNDPIGGISRHGPSGDRPTSGFLETDLSVPSPKVTGNDNYIR